MVGKSILCRFFFTMIILRYENYIPVWWFNKNFKQYSGIFEPPNLLFCSLPPLNYNQTDLTWTWKPFTLQSMKIFVMERKSFNKWLKNQTNYLLQSLYFIPFTTEKNTAGQRNIEVTWHLAPTRDSSLLECE